MLRDGYVLAALPPTVTRVDAVLCLAGGLALVAGFVRTVERSGRSPTGTDPEQAESEPA